MMKVQFALARNLDRTLVMVLFSIPCTYLNPLQVNDGRMFADGGGHGGGGGGDWTNVIIPGDAVHASGISSATYNHRQSYEVSSLRFNAEYECLVQARNQFGWSEASRIFRFFTGKNGEEISRPKHAVILFVTRELSDRTFLQPPMFHFKTHLTRIL